MFFSYLCTHSSAHGGRGGGASALFAPGACVSSYMGLLGSREHSERFLLLHYYSTLPGCYIKYVTERLGLVGFQELRFQFYSLPPGPSFGVCISCLCTFVSSFGRTWLHRCLICKIGRGQPRRQRRLLRSNRYVVGMHEWECMKGGRMCG